MHWLTRLLLVLGLPAACWSIRAQWTPPAREEIPIARVEVRHIGPPTVSDALLRAHIRVKPGDPYRSAAVDEDIRSLYATGQFYNIRVTADRTDEGIVLTYLVQGNPRLTDIKFVGNTKFTDARLRKRISSQVGQPLVERKLFTDSQEIQKLYQSKGYPNTRVKYVIHIDEAAGRASVTFEIQESPKIKIERVEFVGAQAFPPRVGLLGRLFRPHHKGLAQVIKTRRHWMFSWLTGSGYFKDEELEEDRERLADFYRQHGYIDFEIRDVKLEYPSPNRMIVRFEIFEGQPYKVGSVRFIGTTLLPTNAVSPEFKPERKPPPGTEDRQAWHQAQAFHRAFRMKPGDTFTPAGLSNNLVAIENFYGAQGYIDVNANSPNLRTRRIPNTESNTMDLEYLINEGQKVYIEKIDIRGNTKTKDRVIRRELAVAPGEVFDMVGVKISEARLKGLQYFEKVELKPEPTDIPTRRNLLVAVEEKNTGNISLGAGFSSVDALVGFVEFSQGNFDLFHPPTFSGGGQKFRLRLQVGTERQDYILSFVEPWLFDRKLSLSVDLYHRDLAYQSFGGLYDERRTGASIGLRRTLWSDFVIGGVNYTLENVGIDLDPGLHPTRWIRESLPGRGEIIRVEPANAPSALFAEEGNSLVSRLGLSLAWDTRNSALLPSRGQRIELYGEVAGPWPGEKEYWRTELRTAWYFPGLFEGHIIEVIGRVGVADAWGDTAVVPFYDRFYLGGLYSLRGFKYREVSPREPGFTEPVGGNTYWLGSVEYSLPVIQRLRFAVFYDVGNVMSDAFQFDFANRSDNWGFGIRLDLPIGPLRLDYGIPIHYDERYSRGRGRFQFGVGYTREF
ncbi:MAG: outer membrane protein assembly factor BamA [Verrucomicrobiota bacterium]|nr:outer membrane protein assembly factor BamA [Limisphaera sp.]MDW8381437.1 outer membrane protein assembly factor BamA [Verrucomicrobiota bacterium]